MNKGKLIVIEGSDGSGKSTQLDLLKQYLQEQSIHFNSVRFPRYNSFFGKTIRAYLNGELGTINAVNPYLISMVYADDRRDAKDMINKWLQEGLVVLDRYATSNMAHQYARLPDNQREKFLDWVQELEYTVNKIPKEDIVIFLNVPYIISRKLLGNADRGAKDIHEQNEEFLIRSEEEYLKLAKRFPHWVTIECVDANREMKSREEIHKQIIEVLKKKDIIQ